MKSDTFYAERPKKLKKIYYILSTAYGECDVLFDEHDKIIDYWSCNDAQWRNEYFSGALAFFGYEVGKLTPAHAKRLHTAFRSYLVASDICSEEDLEAEPTSY